MIVFDMNYSGVRLYFGESSAKKLEGHLEGFARVAIATSKTAAKVSGALGDVTGLLEKRSASYFVYDKFTPNPTIDETVEFARQAWEYGAEAIVAIGGGSVIDAAKVAALAKLNGNRINDIVYGRYRPSSGVPLFAVNLTHGTGTEIDRYSVISDPDNKEKRGFSSLYPTASVDDPRYLRTLPKDQTVYTSLDAFYHSYEAATRLSSSPYIDMLSRESVTKIAYWLPRALVDLTAVEPRYWLLYASMVAGIAIDMAGTHIIHELEHIVSGINPKVAHGAGLAMLGPRSAYYTHRLSPVKSAEVLSIFDPSLRPSPDDADKAENALRKFQESVGFRERLSDYGFGKDDVPAMVDTVVKNKGLPGPRLLPITEDMVADIFMKSL
ncbi:MAG: iron-containing alcohol dehydrogenase [Thermoprotei archaeon]|jgi:alcohol dehydrogenase